MKYTFTPFPGSVAPAVLAAMAKPYSVEADELVRLNELRIQEIFFPDAAGVSLLPLTRETLLELIFNSFTDAKPILIGVNGPISNQLIQTAKALGKDFEILDINYGSVFRPAQIAKILEQETFSAAFFVEIDPYSGVKLQIGEISEQIRKEQPDAMIFVEASSSLGSGPPVKIGEKADVVFAGLDGSFGIPAGLSIVALSERANLKTFSAGGVGLTLNFNRQKQQNENRLLFASRQYPQLNALSRQLDLIYLEGLERREKRLNEMAESVRKWVEENGFMTLAEADCAANVSTVIKRKAIFTTRALIDYCAAYGVFLGECPDELAEDYFAVAHQNQTGPEELEILFSILEKFIAEYDTEIKVKPRGLGDFLRLKPKSAS